MIPTSDTLRRANQILQEIEGLQTELVRLFGGTGATAPKRRGRPPGSGKAPAATSAEPVQRSRRMSPEGRARIAAAAKARWARFRNNPNGNASNGGSDPSTAKPVRKAAGMSVSGRAAIAAAQKARWAKVRAEKRKAAKA